MTGRFMCSRAAERLYGLEPGASEGTFADFLERVHPEDRPYLVAHIDDALETGRGQRCEFRIVWPDGSVHRLVGDAQIIADEEGQVVSLWGILQDVTSRRPSEEALRLSEARYRSLVLATSHTVWTASADGRVVEDSPSWRSFTGQTFEQYRGLGWLDAVHPDDRERTRRAWFETIAARSSREIEYRIRRRDGAYRVFLARAAPVIQPDGRVVEWTGTTADITERTQAEEDRARLMRELGEQRARLAAVLDAMPSGVLIAEAPSGSISYANRYAESILHELRSAELDLSACADHRATLLDGTKIVPSDYPLARALFRGETVKAQDLVFELKEKKLCLRCNAAPVADEAGRIVAAVCGFEDITREVEEEQQREQLDRFRELFVGMLGHDLRNPLSAIVTGATLLLRRGGLSSVDTRVMERIAAASGRMQRMIEQLLDLTRSRIGGGIPVAPRPMDLHDHVRRVVEELEAANPLSSINLRMSGDPSGMWDPDRLDQVVSNLVGNALEHTAANVPVDVIVERRGGVVRLLVHNGGPPIAPEVLPTIFDPFRGSTPNQRGRPSHGLGLGLYISRQIVAAHGGTLEVESTAENGTTFTATLPIAPPSLQTAA
jgi:PAS domain S-box-containing protein